MRAPLLALALLLSSAPFAVAAEPCVAARADRYEALDALPGLPQGWVPLLALDESRLPAIATLAAAGPGGVCSVTGALPAFVRAAGVAAPEDLARLALASAYPDVLGLPRIDALRVEGGVATATTWHAKDGVVADWTVDLATLQADFVVRAVGVGTFEVDEHGFEGWHVWPGFNSAALRALEAGALATKVKVQPLPDGNQFRLTYFTQFYANEAEADRYAQDYADASLAIWTIQNQGWGFTSADTDGTYDITMDGCSCIYAGNNVNIHVHAKLEDLIRLLNLQYPTFQHFYRIVIGHEWHHHLQYTINAWAGGGALVEGGARFSETIFEPEGAHGPRTIQTLPNINGFSNMMLNPQNQFRQRAYDLGLFWGFLYSQDGGIALLKAVYANAKGLTGTPNDVLPTAIQASLFQVSQTHPAAVKHRFLSDVLGDFAAQMALKSFPWAPPNSSDVRDWGQYLPAARRVPGAGQGGVEEAGASIGTGAVALLSFGGGSAAVGAGAAQPPLGARWVLAGPQGQVVALPAVVAAGEPFTEAVFAVGNPGLAAPVSLPCTGPLSRVCQELSSDPGALEASAVLVRPPA